MDARTLKLKKERENKEYINNYNEKFMIVEYNGNENVKIKFENGYERTVFWTQVKIGNCITPYTKTVCGMGYLGDGKYNPNNHKKIYKIWKSMLERCYDPYCINYKNPTYKDCFVEEYFHCFQNYAQWYENNCPETDIEMHVDKDILEKGNKIYDREHMTFVPREINCLLNKKKHDRGEYPIGVHIRKATPKNKQKEDVLAVQCNIIDENGKTKKIHLGYFPLNRPFQAFYTYKKFKENHIKQVADKYYSKGLITKDVYDALYRYEVEIND